MDIEHTQNQQDLEFKDQTDFADYGNSSQSPEELMFDQVVGLLQEIVICSDFEKAIHSFMKQNWTEMADSDSSNVQLQIFNKYITCFKAYLQQKISSQIANFSIEMFLNMLTDRKNRVDEQILDTLQSLCDLESFRQFIRDYKTSHDEEQMFKVLTIKSNKIPENKKVKGKDNIFGGSSNPMFNDSNMKKPKMKKIETIQKTEDELFVPQLVLTVKGMKKC